MERESSHGTEQFIGNANFSACESGLNFYAVGNGTLQCARKYDEVSSGCREAVDLLPSGVTDSVGTELVRKAVKDADLFVRERHARGETGLSEFRGAATCLCSTKLRCQS